MTWVHLRLQTLWKRPVATAGCALCSSLFLPCTSLQVIGGLHWFATLRYYARLPRFKLTSRIVAERRRSFLAHSGLTALREAYKE